MALAARTTIMAMSIMGISAMRKMPSKMPLQRHNESDQRKADPDERWSSAAMECSSGEAVLTTESMTSADYNNVVKSIEEQYGRLPSGCTATYCPQADWAGCVLRAAGHDFMDFTGSKGGSDGCLDLEDPDNKGLHECLYKGEFVKATGGVSLLNAYDKHCTKVSLADFLVIAAEAVMEITRRNVDGSSPINFKSVFRYGRTTAKACEWARGNLPEGDHSCSAVETTFVKKMKMSWSETAALMGVHSLGRARPENSGWDGWWSDSKNARRFNNNYYISLLAKGWMPEKLSSGKFQWRRSDVGADEKTLGKEMMLDTDLCLAYTEDEQGKVELKSAETGCCAWIDPREIQTGYKKYNDGEFCGDKGNNIPGGGGGAQRNRCCIDTTSNKGGKGGGGGPIPDCGPPRRPLGPAYSAVKNYANDEDRWLKDFRAAWVKATGNGYSKLKKLR